MGEITELRTPDDVEAMLRASHDGPVVLLKHSTMCHVSVRAARELERLAEPEDPPRFLVVVQRARALSNGLAQRLGVRHESPQAHVLVGGRSVLVQNHYEVKADGLREAVRALPTD